MALGVDYDLFWHLSPKKLETFIKSYKIKREMLDEQMWYMGQYIMSALDSTVCNAFRKRSASGGKYFEKPIFYNLEENTKENNYKESQEELAVFEMKKRTKMLEKHGLSQSPM